ncbi:MAG: peroxidase family protein, partial [Myxococcota bacterium]
WTEMADTAATTAGNGVAKLRPNGFDSYLKSRDPDQIAAHELNSPASRVLIDEDWKQPGGYLPAIGPARKAKNWLSGAVTDLLKPLGAGVYAAIEDKPNKPGVWTTSWLPKIGALAALAFDRERLLGSAKTPESVERMDDYVVPGYAHTGPTPSGAFANENFPTAGTVGTPNPIHGPITEYKEWGQDTRLPDVSKLAEKYGYRNGNMIKAPNLSAHVWAHLQQLVHDVMQTMPDDEKKYAVPTTKGSPEQRLGIDNVYYRADAKDEKYGDMNGVTGAWDMSHIYGSSIEMVDKIRTHPANGELCPDGKIYLEGMDTQGRGGKWLPTEIDPATGEEQLITGMNKNITMPLLAEHTLYARHHNWVCDVLKERHPDWHPNQIFQIARRVVTMTYVKIHTGAWTDTTFAAQPVVEGLHANLYGRSERKKPFHLQRIFDPEGGSHPIADGLAGNRTIVNDIEVPEQKGKYFPVAYRFAHAIVNDYFDRAKFEIRAPGDPASSDEKISLGELRDLDGQRFMKEVGLGSVYHGLMNTTMGAPTINNYADMFNRMPSEEGVLDLFQAELMKDRQRG